MKSKKMLSLLISLCILATSLAIAPFVSAVTTDVYETGATLPSNIQDGVILHAWNWSYTTVKNNMQAIADAGYTAVQVSPVQKPKDYNSSWTDVSGQWWKLYQPVSLSFSDGSTWLGTKNDFKAMCTEGDKYGVKVIVDIVANHLANNGGSSNSTSNRSTQIDSSLRSNDAYWHINNVNANDDSRYNMTQGYIGQPDLNTGNTYIQQQVLALLKDCVDMGADGFRFDAAKHIELPNDDSSCKSNFWPAVIDGVKSYAGSKQLYFYGEILYTAGGSSAVSGYSQYMSITDVNTGNGVLANVITPNASSAASNKYQLGADANKTVLWAESHDTYCTDDGWITRNVSNDKIKVAWAIVASRADATSLYLARPSSYSGGKMGEAGDSTWKDKTVAEANKFHNAFAGQTESFYSSGNLVVNERGTTGVLIANLGSSSASVNITAKKMANGTYKDQVSGSTFTVSGGKITGTVAANSVAVVYNADSTPITDPTCSISQEGGIFTTDTLNLTLTLTNATSGTYQIDSGSATSFTGTKQITIGSGVAFGTNITVKLTATNSSKTNSYTYTFTKKDPTTATLTVYYDNSSSNWSNVYCYIYSGTGSSENAAWPGVQMTKGANNIYSYTVPEAFANGNVMFNNNAGSQVPASQQPGLQLAGKSMIYQNSTWKEYTQIVTTTAPVTSTVPVTTLPVDELKLGDANGDGEISLKDATTIQKYMAAMVTLTPAQIKAADANKDGSVSLKDATAIQKYMAGMITL